MRSFDSRQEVVCLLHLGYTKGPKIGSRHIKYFPPRSKKIPQEVVPFMLIMQGKKDVDPRHQKNFIRDIKRHGFTEEEIIKAMWK